MKATGNRLTICCMAALTLCLLFTACQDEEVVGGGSIYRKDICFGVVEHFASDDSTTTSSARSATKATSTRRFVLRNEEATDSLFMSATVVDGITLSDSTSTSVASTRSKPVNSEADMTDFQVWAYWKKGDALQPSFFMNEKITHQGNNVWSSSDNTYYWPGSDYSLRFVAVSPAPTVDDESAGTKDNGLILPTDPSNTSFTYTVPSTASAQPDIMIAASTGSDDGYLIGNYNQPVSLTFEHLCTAIKFKTDDETAAKITSIKLIGIGSSATYSFAEGKWYDPTKVNDADTPFIAENITGEDQTFMMIPQTLPAGATIEIVYDGKTLTANVGGQVWDKSTTVVYNVSVTNWDYTFEVTPINTVFAHTGETSTELFSVISYKKDADNPSGDEIPVNCEVEVLTDDEEWVTVSEPSVAGYTYTYSGAVAAQTKSVAFDPADILKKMPAKGSENNPYNLSNSTGSNEVQNTANCYVVNAPGTYSFPLVYGNAIKGGMDNVAAYTTSNSGTNILETFVNHKDDPIQYPYIKANTDCVPDNVALVWQDAAGLVDADNIRLIDCSTGNVATENTAPQDYRVVFEVPKTTIKPGNAVIAVRSGNNTILWSWHIWVTDYVLGTDLKRVTSNLTGGGGTYELMPYNLGWCGEATTGFAIRGLKLRISQPGSGNSKEINLTQSGILSKKGNNPFYQWGRKDPMLPGKGDGTTTDKDYFSEANYTFLKTSASVTIGTSIQNPFTFYCDGTRWCDSEFHNLWSVGQSNSTDIATKISIKGVYDPCPIGFKVPPVDTFCAFTVDGKTANNAPEKIKGSFNESLNGWDFEAQNSSVFLPITYLRDRATGNLLAALSANYWAALFKKALGFSDKTVIPQGSSYHAAGNPIRPIKE